MPISTNIQPEDLESFINNGGLLEMQVAVTPSPSQQGTDESNVELETNQHAETSVPQSLKAASEHLQGLDIQDPVELLIMLDDDIASGREKLYKWQVQILIDFAKGGLSAHHALHQVVRACNGSGKDKYVIAPCVVWLGMANKLSRSVVTSASGQQLDAQTCAYISDLCEAANRKFQELFGIDIWKINYRYYECLATESIIDCFATDEPKKAEGYHPLRSGAKMGIFVSEDKTVPDDINSALSRCSGYTHRLHVSTPGEPMGHFYDYCSLAMDRNELKSILEVGPIDWIQYHVTAFQCDHLGASHAQKVERESPGGVEGAYYRSVIMAEFGTTDSMVVIPTIYVWKCANGSKLGWIQEAHNNAGLDLADGGDETVLAIRNGNRLLHLVPFKFDNTEQTVKYLDEKFREYHLDNPLSKINGDCIGIGKPILDRLKGMGWSNIHYIDSRNTPHQPRVYKNRNAELWFMFRKLCELNEVWLLDDLKLKKQLATRFYKITGGIHQLESKIDAKAKGRPSPDRADAVVLCYWDYQQVYKPEVVKPPFEQHAKTTKPVGCFTLNEFGAREHKPRYTRHPSANQDDSLIRDLISEHNKMIRSIESS